jgi:hypothetical protein
LLRCAPHDALQVHSYTLRPEPRFFLPHLLPDSGGDPTADVNVSAEYQLLLGPGGAVAVDGVFADHMPSLRDWLAHRTGGRSSRSNVGDSSSKSDTMRIVGGSIDSSSSSGSISDSSSSGSSSGSSNGSKRWRRQLVEDGEAGTGYAAGRRGGVKGSGRRWVWRALVKGAATLRVMAGGTPWLLHKWAMLWRHEEPSGPVVDAGPSSAAQGVGVQVVAQGHSGDEAFPSRRVAAGEQRHDAAGSAVSRPGWLGPGGAKQWSQELGCHVYVVSPAG